jgi:hypothetical protein
MPCKAHQINLHRLLIDGTIDRFAGVSELFWVCGRDSHRFQAYGRDRMCFGTLDRYQVAICSRVGNQTIDLPLT